MTLNDPLANVLSHIKNYERDGKRSLQTRFSSKMIKKVLGILERAGYLGAFNELEDVKGNSLTIDLLGRINDVGVIKPQFQVSVDQFERYEQRFLPAKGFGIIIISTDKGVITLDEAREEHVGGRLIAYCY